MTITNPTTGKEVIDLLEYKSILEWQLKEMIAIENYCLARRIQEKIDTVSTCIEITERTT